jgi:predicted permease
MIRSLLKNWKLNSIAVFSLAIAMGLAVLALSVSDTILLRPPAGTDPGRLVTIFTIARDGTKNNLSYLDYHYLRDHSRTLSGVAGYNYGISKIVTRFNGNDELSLTNAVSDNYFSVLGIQPFLGRFFSPGDDDRKLPAAILTYSCWKRWGADPHVVGKTVTINHHELTILGVAPKQYLGTVFGIGADVILNLATDDEATLSNREYRLVLLAGRLNPGATRAQARTEAQALWGQLVSAYPSSERNPYAEVTAATLLHPDWVRPAQLISAVLIAVVLLILLIACANVANLLLALAAQRRQEALIKTALGATRTRLIAEFLKESTAICAFGGSIGYLLAVAVLNRFSRFDAEFPVFGSMPLAADLHPGTLVFTLILALTLGASLAAGLAPALYASKLDLAAALSGEIAIGGSRRGIIRNTVVIVQVAVCTLVLAGTGLCERSLHNLQRVDPGFSARNIVALWSFSGLDGLSPEDGLKRYDDLRRGAEQIYGVESAAIALDMPLGGDSSDREEIRLPDHPERIFIDCTRVDENYFSTLGIRLLSGRTFQTSDQQKSTGVILINHLMAEKYWPNQNAIGRTVRLANGNRLMTVVGIVADGKYDDLDEAPRPYLYLALRQNYQPGVMLIARTHGDPRLWIEPLSRMARQLGVSQPLPPITMENWMHLTLFVPLATLACVSGLSALGLLLATVGLYGAISYSVSERRRELGIRVALGARPAQLMGMVFRETLATAGAGIIAGLLLAIVTSTLLRAQFFGVNRLEWAVLAPVACAMGALSIIIAWLAARRWIRMDPMQAVRHA